MADQPITIRRLDCRWPGSDPPSEAERAWDRFVRGHRHGSPFHLTAWGRAIAETFRYRPLYLMAWQGERLCGVLPLFLVKNLLLGKALLSTPFAVYGGILAESGEALAALADQAAQLGRGLGVQYVELRNAYPEQRAGWNPVTRYVNFTMAIGADEAAIMEAIARKTRTIIRKSLRHPFVSRRTSERAAFERLYAENLRRLGTPCFPSRHFEALARQFGPEADITEVVLEGRVVAAAFSFYFNNQVLPYYGAADPAYNEASPSTFLYYDQMRRCGAAGYTLFDFGRSKPDTGSYHFKKHWGMAEKQLPYEVLLVRRRDMPNYSPQNPRFHAAIRLWQKAPLPVTRWLGPWLIKLVP
jgi:FemAB-related protein (PEP-CTERM system-associated)